MKRTHGTLLTGTVIALGLALPPVALALTIHVTNSGTVKPPSCPASPCSVLSRTTAFQVKDGSVREPMEIKHSGKLVSWSLTAAAPSSTQISYFDDVENGAPSAALAVVRNTHGLRFEVVAVAPVEQLKSLLGKTTTFTLSHPITVTAGDIVALSVPTWAPVLSVHYPAGTSWRASRSAQQCQTVTAATMQMFAGAQANYDCLYQEALLTYSATEVTTTRG